MRAGVWILMLLAIAGCRAPVTILRPGTPAPTYQSGEPLTPVSPSKIEPVYSKLPPPQSSLSREAFVYRGLDEKNALRLAVANSSLAKLLEAENAKTSVLGSIRRCGTVNAGADDLLREVRLYAALDARNRAGLEALERYYQLAEAEGRDELFTMALVVMKTLREKLPVLRDAGLPTPKDDDLLRDETRMLAERESLEMLIAGLNHDLNSKLGTRLESNERFWPKDDFGMWNDAIDVEAAVKYALAKRPDLQLLRLVRDRTNAGTLPTITQVLSTYSPLVTSTINPAVNLKAVLFRKSDCPDPLAQADAEARKQEIEELLASREAEAASQVRTAARQLATAAKRVALLRSRAEGIEAKLAIAKSEARIADVLTLESDHLKARADVLAAVFEWHQWRVKLKAAQGLLVTECLSSEIQEPGSGPGIVPLKVSRRLH